MGFFFFCVLCPHCTIPEFTSGVFGKKIASISDFLSNYCKGAEVTWRDWEGLFVGNEDLGWSLSGTGGFPQEITLESLGILDPIVDMQ